MGKNVTVQGFMNWHDNENGEDNATVTDVMPREMYSIVDSLRAMPYRKSDKYYLSSIKNYKNLTLCLPIYPGTDSGDRRYQTIIKLFNTNIINGLYKRVYNKKVEPAFFSPGYIVSRYYTNNPPSGMSESIVNRIFRDIRVLRKSKAITKDSITTARLSDGSSNIQLYITANNDDEKCSKYSCVLWYGYKANGKTVSMMYLYHIDLHGINIWQKVSHKAKCCLGIIENVMQASDDVKQMFTYAIDDTVPTQHLFFIEQLLSVMEEQQRLDYKDLKIPEYTNIEMDVYSAIFDLEQIELFSHIISEFRAEDSEPVEIDDSFVNICKPGIETNEWPIVKLSDKEWKFVNKWLEDNKIYQGEIDLHKYLDNPRYGRHIKIPYTKTSSSNDEIEYESMLNAGYQFVDDHMELIVWEEINPDCNIALVFRIDDPSHFKGFKGNQLYMATTIVCDNVGCVPRGTDSLVNMAIIPKFTNHDAYRVLNMIMKVFVIIYHRPERTRMVKYSENRKVYSNKNNRKSATAREYTVWRMLAPVKEAKEYVQRMSTGRSNREAVYTLEEWDRCGHYRTLKSGRVIYIRPTHCQRRLPINETREIQLKL